MIALSDHAARLTKEKILMCRNNVHCKKKARNIGNKSVNTLDIYRLLWYNICMLRKSLNRNLKTMKGRFCMFQNEKTVERVKAEYPIGTRVELVYMNDVQAPPKGMKGTVVGVDDIASLLVKWDNGSGLNVVYGVDFVRKTTD